MPKTSDKSAARTLLGEALVKEGVITDEQLDRALRVQRYMEEHTQLGQVLIELGYATKQSIGAAISKHGSGMRLGDLLLAQGLVSAEALDHALVIQQERGLKLGEALVELGAITDRALRQNLAHQAGVPYIEPVFAMIEGTVLSGISPDYLDRNEFIPFSRGEDGHVTVVVSDLHDEQCLQTIRELYKGDLRLALGPPDAIKQAIADYRRFREQRQSEKQDKEKSPHIEQDAVVQLVNHIISSAIRERASDIHIEPMSDVIRLRYRIDGSLVYKTDLPLDLLSRLISRIKILAECDIAEHQRHQGGRIVYDLEGRDYDLRLSIYVTVHGESVVIRVLNKYAGLIDLEELGMNTSLLDRYRNLVLDPPTGVVMVTGPTGSGKTTTLYSSLNYSNSVDTKIITAEDPVEYVIDGIVQCAIFEKVGRTFENTLREIVRQDPDIIVLGEIRDRTSAEIAIQAALTGHKVYSTFHTEDAVGALVRLIDMGIEPFLVSSTVLAVLAQRLLRRVCPECATPYQPSTHDVERLGLDPHDVHDFELKRGRGCKKCNYTGYHGRAAAYELLLFNDAIKHGINERQSAHTIRQVCQESTSLVSMREDGIAKAIRGLTTLDEVLYKTPQTMTVRPLRQILAMTQ